MSTQPHATKIRQLSNNHERTLIDTWDSISEAARVFEVSVSSIQAVLVGRTSSAGGFAWEYEDEDLRAVGAARRTERATLSGKSKPIWRIAKDTGDREPFGSAAAAAASMGLTTSAARNITKALRRANNFTEGYYWELRA